LRRSSQSYENLNVRMKPRPMRSSASCEDLSALRPLSASAADDQQLRRSRRRESSSAPVSRNLSSRELIPNDSSKGGKSTIYPDLATLVRSRQREAVGQQEIEPLLPVSAEGDSDTKDCKGSLSGLAACLIMAASPCVDITADAEVGSLIASGHVDILTAKVCTMPPAVTAPPLVGMPSDQPSANSENTMTAFLEDTADPRVANEAACLASGSYDEAPTPTSSRVRMIEKTTERQTAAREALAKIAIEEESFDDDDLEYSSTGYPSPSSKVS